MRRGALVVAVAVGIMGGACGLGNRDAEATRIVNAGKRLLAAPTVDAILSARVGLVRVANKPVNPGPPRLAPEHVAGIVTEINAPAGTAAIGIAAPGATPAIVFVHHAIYQRIAPKAIEFAGSRLTAVVPSNFNALAATYTSQLTPIGAPAAGGGATTTTTLLPQLTLPTTTTSTTAAPSLLRRRVQIVRQWAMFDYAAIADHDQTKHAGSLAINPVDLLRLTQGVLTGSIERRGTEHGLVRFDANVSRDKAERDLSEDARKVLDKEFTANAITRTVFPAKFWLDAHGNLRRLELTLRQQLTPVDRGDLTVSFDLLSPAAAPLPVTRPSRRVTAESRTLGELVTTVTGQ
ncbi:MAG TPA: hypothetical protein VHD87_07065 [Acidimicrobiales bacterium]|nr:hypothetical protein [Acidimicrobiales bacterium]